MYEAIKNYGFNRTEWSSWVELHVEYKESCRKVDEYRTGLKRKGYTKGGNVLEEVELELLGSMKNGLEEAVRELKRRTLYEFGTLNEDDVANPILTERQREVAGLRQRYSCSQVARMLGLSPKTVFTIYKQAVSKIEKFKERERENVPQELSPQQSQIYILYKRGVEPKAIAEEIGTTYGNVRKQLSLIKRVTRDIRK